MAKMNYEHVFAAAGFSGEQFDIAAGPANTGIIDVLLSAGDGVLTSDAPHVLVSTGALNAAGVALDISALETEKTVDGGEALPGRFFYLSIQNSNISTVNTITVSSSATINGAATFVINSTGDYLFHHVAAGVWRVNSLPRPNEPLATIARVNIAAGSWASHAYSIPQATHGLVAASSYVVNVINQDLTPDEIVDVEVQFNAATGDITLRKGAKAPNFNGVAVIIGSFDPTTY